jgi:hypothetical protein
MNQLSFLVRTSILKKKRREYTSTIIIKRVHMLQYMHELPVYMCLWSSIYLMGLGHDRTKMQLQLRRTGKRDLFMIGIGLSHGRHSDHICTYF